MDNSGTTCTSGAGSGFGGCALKVRSHHQLLAPAVVQQEAETRSCAFCLAPDIEGLTHERLMRPWGWATMTTPHHRSTDMKPTMRNVPMPMRRRINVSIHLVAVAGISFDDPVDPPFAACLHNGVPG